MNTLSFQNENKTAAPEAAEKSRLAAIKKWSRGAIRGVAAGAFAAGLGLAAAQPAEAGEFRSLSITQDDDKNESAFWECVANGEWMNAGRSKDWMGWGQWYGPNGTASESIDAVARRACPEGASSGGGLEGWDVEQLKEALKFARYAEEDCEGQRAKDFDFICKDALDIAVRNFLDAVVICHKVFQ